MLRSRECLAEAAPRPLPFALVRSKQDILRVKGL